MSVGEQIVNAISMAVLISVFFFLLSFGFVRVGLLFAITGVFEHPLYWVAFFLVTAFGAIAGGGLRSKQNS